MEKPKVKKLDLYQLPMKGNIVSHYMNLTEDGQTKTDAISAISATLIDIWNRADCPCIDYKHVKNHVGDLLENYRHRVTAHGDDTPAVHVTHRHKKPHTEVEPTRKSERRSTDSEAISHDQSEHEPSTQFVGAEPGPSTAPKSSVSEEKQPRPSSKTCSQSKTSTAEQSKHHWFHNTGMELFDILSQVKKDTHTFDDKFYTDQKGP